MNTKSKTVEKIFKEMDSKFAKLVNELLALKTFSQNFAGLPRVFNNDTVRNLAPQRQMRSCSWISEFLTYSSVKIEF